VLFDCLSLFATLTPPEYILTKVRQPFKELDIDQEEITRYVQETGVIVIVVARASVANALVIIVALDTSVVS